MALPEMCEGCNMNKPEPPPAMGANHVRCEGIVVAHPWHSPARDGHVESGAVGMVIHGMDENGKACCTYLRTWACSGMVTHIMELRPGDNVRITGRLSWWPATTGRDEMGVLVSLIERLGTEGYVETGPIVDRS